MSKKVSVITVIILMTILVGWYFNFVSLYYIIPLIVTFIIINTLGSTNLSFNYFIYSHCKSTSSDNNIAITFDDGPHPEITPKLLDLLEQNKVPATFFCTGKNTKKYSDIIIRILKNNHIIGNHSYGHSYFFDFFSSSRMQKEIIDTNNIIKQITGKTPLLFRPPYGVTNPMLRKAIVGTNMVSVGWSLRSLDTIKTHNDVITKLKANTKAGDIILFHDTNSNIITIIEEYITWLQKNDFKIVSLTNLLNIPAYAD